MIHRDLHPTLLEALADSPAVALLGPRQAGKTTLARQIGDQRIVDQLAGSIYLDLESPQDRQKLFDAEAYLRAHENKLVILDEVQHMPELFQALRSLIDQGRRKGLLVGRFLLLGSASGELLRQSGESLAGRIAYLELPPLQPLELKAGEQDQLWLRGGFPSSFLASSQPKSMSWRQNLINTYLQRDIPAYGTRIPAETLRRLWTMLAHHQGGLLDVSTLGRNLMLDAKTVHRYLDLFVDLMLLRRLSPWHSNVGKRMVKSPKLYIRDSGLVHALLGIVSADDLLAHPVVGSSWVGFVVEALLNAAPVNTSAGFYRTSNGAEIDLVLNLPGHGIWAIEIKRGMGSPPRRGFYSACEDIQPSRRFVVYPAGEAYPLGEGVEAAGVRALVELLRKCRLR
ncbi:MAG: ATP-binding protein [Polaromonas sp.]|uniref:ATP-binding protein n=1 Tax=Polaromonas sp. TaxID=1869339 RepID=UPI002737534D|nr:ATP-binding protein [Polaromonas sp.]MDP2817258.1 ATP-binding protein [Polaromonas sp.]